MLEGSWREPLTGEHFLLAEDGDIDKIIVYASDKSLRLLTEGDDINDGTLMEHSERVPGCSIRSSQYMHSFMAKISF